MPKTDKTNAMRVLDARKIPYVTHHYAAERHSAEEVAALVGFPANQVFKTLVVLPEKGRPLLAIVAGDSELDLKMLAQASGDKRLRMATQREAESLTGLLVGGISALALLNKGFRVFLDASASQHETILVSAGQRGINLQLRPQDLAEMTSAQQADIAHAPAEN
ncbi:MAG: Cys-tRNA(Pro) deacylase [Anaerolineae bacterium]